VTRIACVLTVLSILGSTVAAQQRADTAKTPARPDTSKTKPATPDSARITALEKRLDSIENNSSKVITFGLGLGLRTLGISGHYELLELSISSKDSTLQIDTLARAAFILSGTVMARPFKSGRFGKNLIFLADLNLAEFASKDVLSISNKVIQGGAGLGYRLDPSFSLGFTLERISTRKPRASVLQRVGQKISGPNGVVTNITTDDNTFYRDANLGALSFWFIYRLK